MKVIGKILKWILIIALVLVLAVMGGINVMYQGEINTMAAIRQLDDQLFALEYKADYGFTEFLEVGASSDAEVKDFIMKRLLRGMPIDFELPTLGCSTFSAKMENGDSVFGRNFDELACPMMVVTTRPENGYASISMVNLSYIGYSDSYLPDSIPNSLLALAAPYVPLDGVNEMGLSAGILFIASAPTNQQTDKVDITTTTAVRMILDRCATVDEAVEMLSQYDMHSSANACFHIHIADAQGGSVVVEYVNDEMMVVEENAATNFLFNPQPGVREIGRDRYDVMKARLEENGGVFKDMRDAMSLLEAVQQKGDASSRAGTRWSCVYNQTEPALLLSVNRDYGNLYTFALEK